MSQSSTYGLGGGGGIPITTINGDTGSATGSIITFDAYPASGQSVFFHASGSTVALDITDSDGNTLLGLGSGDAGISGTNNTALGKESLNVISTGSNNIAIGYQAMAATTAGNNNIVISVSGTSNSNDLGDDNIIIGESGPALIAGSNGVTVIGSAATSVCSIAGIDGVNLGNTVRVVTMGGVSVDQLGTADITAGSGISITPSANTITIAATGAGSFAWSIITADQTAAVNNGYICNKAGTLALALPATSAVGDIIEVTNQNTALGIQFTQSTLQQILLGNSGTTIGATGTLTSSAVGDSLKLVCITANLTWRAVSGWGNWTPA